ncbi:MAG TPA: hypothetical protein VK578_24620 [Edaphobacter sp.]|nr:hypothetical protein [Edaphobacter sp.]
MRYHRFPMEFRELIDRSDTIFGRAPDLDHLLQRSERPGITAVVARSQMGKSTLLMELARRLSHDPPPSLLGPQPRLIGFTESAGETSDIMLRGVIDLYTRWLSDSSYSDQARITWLQQKKNGISKTGKAVGTVFKALSAATPLKDIGDLVQKGFDTLATANDNLLSGGVQAPPRLQSEQALELLTIIHEITGHPIVLVFDQWEKSLNIQIESNVLDTFLRHIREWPPCHIFLGLRPEGDPHKAVKSFQSAWPAAAGIHNLPPLHLEGQSALDLLQYLREHVPVTKNVSDADLLDMIAGHPEVVNRWTTPSLLGPGASIDDLRRVADDAHKERYSELESLLFSLPANLRPLAMRLSILPATKDPDRWRTLKPLILADAKAEDLDDLGVAGVLESVAPPTYGHIKRTEAALRWFKSKRPGALGEICDHLIRSVAGNIRDLSPQAMPYAESLVTIAPLAFDLELSRLSLVLCQSARSLFDLPLTAPDAFLGSASELQQVDQSLRPLLAMGLYNSLNDAVEEGKLERCDALLIDLRSLAHDYPEDAAVREYLAKGLYNTLNNAVVEGKLERRDALLTDLRSLAHDYPEDAAVRERLAKGLYNTLNDAVGEEKLERRDALLIDLRSLARDYPEDAAVREHLAKGLYNTLNDAVGEGKLERRDALLIDLRSLAHDYPRDAAVRERFAKGLYNTLNHVRQEGNLERRDALLTDLRSLAHDHPEDAAVREQFAKALYNALYYARQEEKLEHRDALLTDLRGLAHDYPEDTAVRENLARGLFNTLLDAKQEGKLERRDPLLTDLRSLAHAHPEDAAVRERFAKGLFSTLLDARQEGKIERHDALLIDLRSLIQTYPEDPISIQISAGLADS